MDAEQEERLREHGRKIAGAIGQSVPEGVGFALILFDFGGEGFLTYLSNAAREDMIKVLREAAKNIEAGGSWN